MSSAWGGSWGSAWGNAWGSINANLGDMAGQAGFALHALAAATATGAMVGGSTFTYSALGTLTTLAIPDVFGADSFNYQAALRTNINGRFAHDPRIASQAARKVKHRRW